MEVDKHLESEERTSVLANERTYAAWIRTGLTSLVAGLAFEKFLHGVVPTYVVHYLSFNFIVFSSICFMLGAIRYRHVGKRLKSEKVTGASDALLFLISFFLCVSALVSLCSIYFLM